MKVSVFYQVLVFYQLILYLTTPLDEDAARKNPMYHLKSVNAETRDVLTELEREYKPAVKIHAKSVLCKEILHFMLELSVK